jgi:hypothetical protein
MRLGADSRDGVGDVRDWGLGAWLCLPAAGVPKPTSATAGDDPRQARSTGRGQMRSRRVVCGMCASRKELTNVTILCTRDKQAMLV